MKRRKKIDRESPVKPRKLLVPIMLLNCKPVPYRYKKKEYQPYTGRNPKTGEKIKVNGKGFRTLRSART